MTVNHGAAQRAYQLLRRDIVAGVIAAGSKLAENDLAEQYGLSRTPIREALRRLQSEGLVEVEPNRGARVVDWHNFDVEGIYEGQDAEMAPVSECDLSYLGALVAAGRVAGGMLPKAAAVRRALAAGSACARPARRS